MYRLLFPIIDCTDNQCGLELSSLTKGHKHIIMVVHTTHTLHSKSLHSKFVDKRAFLTNMNQIISELVLF